jgi:AAA+ superfamily predicted ATPase
MTLQSLEGRVRHLLSAKTPILLVVTDSEDRVQEALSACLPSLPPGTEGWSWTLTEGLRSGQTVLEGTTAIAEALDAALKVNRPAVFFFKDLHLLLGSGGDPWVIRRLRDLAAAFPGRAKALVFRSATVALPDDLVPTVTVVEDAPPTRVELLALLQDWKGSAQGDQGSATPEFDEQYLRAVAGLPLYEVHRILGRIQRRSPGVEGRLLSELLDERSRLVNRSGLLESVLSDVAIEQVGGLQNFKEWLECRRHVFTEAARQAGGMPPRGVLLMGITGCGKSIAVKAAARFWKLPLVRLDMVRLYGGELGAPEGAIRRATRWAESLAPCVLWMDEMEAGINVAGHKAEGGPASRILGYFLTWMQERRAPVFVGATANAIDLLPAEALRKGRFDEIFYVSLPNKADRRDIFRIHLERRGIRPDGMDVDLLAHGTRGYSGSEIEQIVATALIAAQSEGRPIASANLVAAASRTVPMSVTMAEQIKRIENWAFRRAVQASAKGED